MKDRVEQEYRSYDLTVFLGDGTTQVYDNEMVGEFGTRDEAVDWIDDKEFTECPHCEGSGKYGDHMRCFLCYGEGKISEEQHERLQKERQQKEKQ